MAGRSQLARVAGAAVEVAPRLLVREGRTICLLFMTMARCASAGDVNVT